MKQTAVEWLANEFYEKLEVKGDGALFNDLVNQAKEIEKQQQGYSEEDMKKSYFSAIESTGEGWNGEYAEGNGPNIEEKFTEGFEEWFKEFKKEII